MPDVLLFLLLLPPLNSLLLPITRYPKTELSTRGIWLKMDRDPWGKGRGEAIDYGRKEIWRLKS